MRALRALVAGTVIAGLAIIVVVSLWACESRYAGSSKWRLPADPAVRERAARFVVECSEAANPRADEEGEDLVAQCEKTALHLFGAEHRVIWDGATYHDCTGRWLRYPECH